eukprot:CAMPEP_0179104060 /NCGR_PEP_ID=MMETSP0796-20121207/48250_1 /TAXON_ID=73915 /ORGANISM="Pyrodinium bahamense, Strain pbaha01" /LENGTH=347 /DNA_ID=CAMNT_0020801989 /DNA_START=159 /DNA_END=1202 /DNA_ORIENTATION=-
MACSLSLVPLGDKHADSSPSENALSGTSDTTSRMRHAGTSSSMRTGCPMVPDGQHSRAKEKVQNDNSSSESRQFQFVASLAVKMLRTMTFTSIDPNMKCYAAAITACGQGDQLEGALWLMSQMQGEQICANSEPFGAVARRCSKNGPWESALYLMALTQGTCLAPKAGKATSSSGQGHSWQRALDVLCGVAAAQDDAASGKDHEMRKLRNKFCTPGLAAAIKGVRSIEPYAATHAAAIRRRARVGRWESPTELLEAVLGAGREPSTASLEAAIRCCGERGSFEEACALMEDLSWRHIRPGMHVLRDILRASASSRQLSQQELGHPIVLDLPAPCSLPDPETARPAEP